MEKDPNGKDQHDSGAKLDAGKPDASLLGMFGNALLAVAEVGTFGAEKYTRGGWRSVPDGVYRYTAAMLRHYFAEDRNEYDADLPVRHAAQVAWNALARLELIIGEGDTKHNDPDSLATQLSYVADPICNGECTGSLECAPLVTPSQECEEVLLSQIAGEITIKEAIRSIQKIESRG